MGSVCCYRENSQVIYTHNEIDLTSKVI